ncbi:hypothetical protein BEL04_03795 [Mucilaginibacter sp. PPCGB 2223]|uniref:hypothetical protein n=1 Tax=Mucilaginibacter sp. PPCGB 2223 TaxID=1886027 RepID=UPI00082694C3|nr:hypothetical protein [Mucilaginibacter sp. PPCGB 2223]OCX53433.1 hypothetical protein BEL04_03795 [Mucilaginibacter sp. PPCGB 2223]
MEPFETTLTGSDGEIAGTVKQLSKEAYQFTSVDGALYLTITKNEDGRWIRLSGSEPYFSGWVDELTEKIASQPKTVKTAATITKSKTATALPVKKAKVDTDKKTTVKVSANKKAKVSSAVTKTK